MTQFAQIVNQPFLYVNGLNLSRPAARLLNISAGQCRDSTNQFDLIMPDVLSINLNVNGVGGLDTGTVAVSQSYDIYIIADATGYNQPVAIAKLTGPAQIVMPQGNLLNTLYNLQRRIGYVVTDAGANIVNFRQDGLNSEKFYQYESGIQVLTAGVAAAFAAVNLFPALPNVGGIKMLLSAQTAGNSTLEVRPTGSVATILVPYRMGGTAGNIDSLAEFITGVNISGNPSLDYQINASNVNLQVAGFIDSL